MNSTIPLYVDAASALLPMQLSVWHTSRVPTPN